MLAIMAHLEWRLFVNTWWRKRGRRVGLIVLLTLLVAAFVGLSYGLSLASPIPFDVFDIIAVFAPLFVVVISITVGINSVFQSLFSASDVSGLFSMPIPVWTIYATKFMRVIAGELLIPAITAAALLGMGWGAGFPWVYYVVLFLGFLGLLFISLAFSGLIDLVLVHFLPRAKVQNLLAMLSALTGIFFAVVGQIPNFMINTGRDVNEAAMAGFHPWWLIPSWLTEALQLAARGNLASLLWLIPLLATGLGLFALSLLFVERGFRLGWIRQSEGTSKKATSRKAPHRIRPTWQAVFSKELALFRRTPLLWLSALPMVSGFGVLVMLMLTKQDSFSKSGIPGQSEAIWIIVNMLLFFFGTSLGSATALGAVGREGETPWLLCSLPVNGRQAAWGKFWANFVLMPAMLVPVEILMGLLLHWQLWQIAAGSLALTLLSPGHVGISLGLSALGAKYDHRSKAGTIVGGVYTLDMFATLLYNLVAFVLILLMTIPPQMSGLFSSWAAALPGGFWAGILRGLLLAVNSYLGLSTLWRYFLSFGLTIAFMLAVTWAGIATCAARINRGITIKITQAQ